jgi:sugar phosphate permease
VFCISGILAFFTTKIPLPAHYLICLGLGIFGSAVVVIGFTTNKELFPVQMAGTATGLVNLFPFAGGAVFQPILGYVLEAQGRVNDAFTIQGYQYAFMVLFACGTIALVASFFFKETLGRDA